MPKFVGDKSFQVEVRRRIDEFFQSTGLRQRDCAQMYLKTAILLVVFTTFYILLVFVAKTWWHALPLAILLGLATAAIGFNIQHDGGHLAYSNHDWVNKMMAMTLDVIGGSSYHWHYKHVVLHHMYVNITGHDTDVEVGVLGRLTPHQKRRWYHRWQHYYLWPLYSLMAINWHFVGDFRDIITGRIGEHRFPRPRRWDLVILVVGKLIFFAVAFGIPLVFHSVWVVASFYAAATLALGLVLSVVFQLAHCVEQAEFPLLERESGHIENPWAVHQVETTVNFGRRSSVISWLLGGLNFQVEHHLFPRICHVNYPAISPVVEQTCREFGVKYNVHVSVWAGLKSHFRWLRQMGTADAGREIG